MYYYVRRGFRLSLISFFNARLCPSSTVPWVSLGIEHLVQFFHQIKLYSFARSERGRCLAIQDWEGALWLRCLQTLSVHSPHFSPCFILPLSYLVFKCESPSSKNYRACLWHSLSILYPLQTSKSHAVISYMIFFCCLYHNHFFTLTLPRFQKKSTDKCVYTVHNV